MVIFFLILGTAEGDLLILQIEVEILVSFGSKKRDYLSIFKDERKPRRF